VTVTDQEKVTKGGKKRGGLCLGGKFQKRERKDRRWVGHTPVGKGGLLQNVSKPREGGGFTVFGVENLKGGKVGGVNMLTKGERPPRRIRSADHKVSDGKLKRGGRFRTKKTSFHCKTKREEVTAASLQTEIKRKKNIHPLSRKS